MQLGAGRGGFYSYEWLENYLLFCPIENANSIIPEWQNLRVGDEVRLCPGDFGPPPYTVADIEPERALILGHPPQNGAASSEGAWNDTWAFVLQPTDDGNTRLILRTRGQSPTALDRVLEPGIFFMERGMLLGIKERAERAPAGRSSAEILSFTFLGIAGLGIVGVLLSRKWPWTLAVACGGVFLLTLVLFIEHPSPVLGALLALAIFGALVWAYWPRRSRPTHSARPPEDTAYAGDGTERRSGNLRSEHSES